MSFIVKGINLPKDEKKPLRIEIWSDGDIYKDYGYGYEYEEGIAIQIPKEHGRLKDDKEILARAEQEVDGLVMSAEHLPMVLEWILDKSDTFLEAEE